MDVGRDTFDQIGERMKRERSRGSVDGSGGL